GTSSQWMAVAGIDEEDLKPLGLEQRVQGNPRDAGRFQGDRVDLMLTQEGGNGFQAVRVGRELFNQAGSGCGAEADTDPVGPGTDVDAGRVRTSYGQCLDLGSLLLAKGFALALRPGFTAVIGLALGLSLNALAAGRRRGSGLAFGRRCGHSRTPRTRRRERIGSHAPRQRAGESTRTNQGCKREPRDPGKKSPGRSHQG